jgi:hypothetical protein
MDRNAPRGLHGYGGVTVIDPSAKPLDDAPSSTAGGLFAGHMTDREWTPKAQPSSCDAVHRSVNVAKRCEWSGVLVRSIS